VLKADLWMNHTFSGRNLKNKSVDLSFSGLLNMQIMRCTSPTLRLRCAFLDFSLSFLLLSFYELSLSSFYDRRLQSNLPLILFSSSFALDFAAGT
jgi:hypothetical protein